MMITLMLAMALIMLGLLAVLPDLKQQAQRDREEELRHRGTSYMRAIQHFYKKFGRYPGRIEELENTNNVRFLRKRYTDPMTRDSKTGKEKDFKLLHQQDISLNTGPVLPLQGGPGGTAGASALGGAVQGALSALGTQAGGLQQTGGMGGQTSLNGNSDNSSSGNSSGTGNGTGNSNSPGSSSSGFNGPTFGGGPILGVASTSKAKTIRVFADKTHYNDWLFIYLSQFDVGGLLVGPVNPNQPPAANLNGPTAGQPGVGMPQGIGGLGQGQMPNSGFTQGFSQQQNSGQTLPNQTPPQQ